MQARWEQGLAPMSEEGSQRGAELSLPGEGPVDLPGRRRRIRTLELSKGLAAARRSEAAAPDRWSSGKYRGNVL